MANGGGASPNAATAKPGPGVTGVNPGSPMWQQNPGPGITGYNPGSPKWGTPPGTHGSQITGAAGGQTQPNGIFGGAASGINTALTGATGLATGGPTSVADANLDNYMNPYTSSVIDATLGNLADAKEMALNDVGAAASAAGAFGGARHGIAEGQVYQNFADTAADTAAKLNMAGFDKATQLAGQDVATGLAGNQLLGSLAGQAFGMGNTINQNLSQQGLLQQMLQQQLIDAGKGQFYGWAGSPGQSLSYPLAALGVAPNVGTTTQTKNPGLFDILGLALAL